jgi:hypothetical protein
MTTRKATAKGKDNSKCNSIFPSEMTTRKARATATAESKSNGNDVSVVECLPSHPSSPH